MATIARVLMILVETDSFAMAIVSIDGVDEVPGSEVVGSKKAAEEADERATLAPELAAD